MRINWNWSALEWCWIEKMNIIYLTVPKPIHFPIVSIINRKKLHKYCSNSWKEEESQTRAKKNSNQTNCKQKAKVLGTFNYNSSPETDPVHIF